MWSILLSHLLPPVLVARNLKYICMLFRSRICLPSIWKSYHIAQLNKRYNRLIDFPKSQPTFTLVPLLILTLLWQIRSTPKLWSSCTRNLVPISRIYYCFLTTKIKNPVTTETPKKSFIPHLRPFCLRHIRLTYELGLSEMYIHVSPNDVLSLSFDNKYFSWSKKNSKNDSSFTCHLMRIEVVMWCLKMNISKYKDQNDYPSLCVCKLCTHISWDNCKGVINEYPDMLMWK